jgi:hypothetical protein
MRGNTTFVVAAPDAPNSPYGEAASIRAIGPVLVKESVKLEPKDRARLLAWLLLYFNDDGSLYSPQISRRRQRITLDGIEYWFARVPKNLRWRGSLAIRSFTRWAIASRPLITAAPPTNSISMQRRPARSLSSLRGGSA